MKKTVLLLLLNIATLFASTINIAVAANVSYAIEELKSAFEKQHPEVDVKVILGSSGKLKAQIVHGAPYGLFLSANMKYPQALYASGLTLTKPLVYAKGTLALLSVKKYKLSEGFALLKSKNIQRIAVANPKTAPYGEATEEALKNAQIYDAVKRKFIYGESISTTLSYARTAADIGIVASSSLYSPQMQHYKKGSNWVPLDTQLYKPIEQGIVLLKRAGENAGYRAFYEFILSESAKKIFQKYGYIVHE